MSQSVYTAQSTQTEGCLITRNGKPYLHFYPAAWQAGGRETWSWQLARIDDERFLLAAHVPISLVTGGIQRVYWYVFGPSLPEVDIEAQVPYLVEMIDPMQPPPLVLEIDHPNLTYPNPTGDLRLRLLQTDGSGRFVIQQTSVDEKKQVSYLIFDFIRNRVVAHYGVPLALMPDGFLFQDYDEVHLLAEGQAERIIRLPTHKRAVLGATYDDLITANQDGTILRQSLIAEGDSEILGWYTRAHVLTQSSVLWQDSEGIHVFRAGTTTTLMPKHQAKSWLLTTAQENRGGLIYQVERVGPGTTRFDPSGSIRREEKTGIGAMRFAAIQHGTVVARASHPMVLLGTSWSRLKELAGPALDVALPPALVRYVISAI